jgi:anaerobic dimethyl sulfoxide reductase subunit B (iron-sulfur subunit)
VGILYRQVRSYETGAFPNPGYYHHSSTCNHCAKPACVVTCPSGALHIADNDTVQIDTDICIGCQSCVRSCPYGVPQFFEDREVSGKCNFCIDLISQGQNPVCVDACPQRVLEWGGLDKLAARHPEAVRDLPILPSSDKTQPSTLITPRTCALDTKPRLKLI